MMAVGQVAVGGDGRGGGGGAEGGLWRLARLYPLGSSQDAAAAAAVVATAAAGAMVGKGGAEDTYSPMCSCPGPPYSCSYPTSSSPSSSPSSCPPSCRSHYRRRLCFRRRRRFIFTPAAAAVTVVAAFAGAVATALPTAAEASSSSVSSATGPGDADGDGAASANAVGEGADTTGTATLAAAVGSAGEGDAEPCSFSKHRLVATASPPTTANECSSALKPTPFWRRQLGTTPATSTRSTSATPSASDTGFVAGLLRSITSGTRRRRLLEDVLKVLVWSFFAERLLQSALVGWGQSGRVGAVEQLGGKLIEGDVSDTRDPSYVRFVETQVLLLGVRMGRDTVHLNTARAAPEMFTKVDCTEIQHPSPKRGEGQESGDSAEGPRQDEEASASNPLVFYEYAAPAFAHLRGLYGISSSEYRRSFREGSRMIAHASNSKSAQSFMFTEDGKYMLKTASESELDSMLRLLPRYAAHVSRRRGSLITRFFGIYRVTDPKTKRSTVFVSSSNVFSTEKRLHERYDLKGSVVGRRTISPNSGAAIVKPTTMLKDLDLANGSEKIQLAVGCKKRLLAELRSDAEFLADLGVMDYSLLVGVHRPFDKRSRSRSSKILALPLGVLYAAIRPVWATGCLVASFLPGCARKGGRSPQVGVYPGREPGVVYYMGIIDVLQRYNLRKILERGAKAVVYNRHEISAVPPEEYRDRFIDFIDRSTE